jgi:lysophospholipase L1-like esterase
VVLLVSAVVLVTGLVAVAVLLNLQAGPPPVTLYLAVGDSLAAGYQPSNPGDRTDRTGGYAGPIRAGLAAEQPGSPAPKLVNLGCPGETTRTLTDGALCSDPAGSQLDEAVALLRRQPDGAANTVVTVQVGANDVQRCVRLTMPAPSVDQGCLEAGLDAVRADLPAALHRMRAAGPRARIVVLDYYNPFVVASVLGAQGERLAEVSAEGQRRLNAEIASAAKEVGAPVADVSGAFARSSSTTASRATPPGLGSVCAWTWACTVPPDVHATTAGYDAMAQAVLRALPVR